MSYYTTKEAAKKLGVCEQRIRAKISQGHFPNSQKFGKRSWMISEDDLKLNLSAIELSRRKKQS